MKATTPELDDCPNCFMKLEVCGCACPFCGEVAGCNCAIGRGVATGG